MVGREVPWLETRGDIYYAFWYDRDAKPQPRIKRLSLRTRDAEEAALRFAAFLTEAGHIDQPAARRVLTAAVALDHYMEEHVREKVVDQERIKLMSRHLVTHFGAVLVAEIDIPMCRLYRERRERGEVGQPSGPATIRRELGTLVAAINHEVKWKRVPRGDVPHIELPQAPPPRDRWLTREELGRLLEAARYVRARGPDGSFTQERVKPATLPRIYRFVMLAYYTGARKGAVLSLTRDQVDLDAGLIYLNPKGRAQTRKRRPVVPFNGDLRPTLEATLKQIGTCPYLLDHPGSIDAAFATLCRRAEVKDCTPHVLRHTRATHLLQDGKDPWAVAGLLGDTIQTIMSTYGHHSPEHLREALAG